MPGYCHPNAKRENYSDPIDRIATDRAPALGSVFGDRGSWVLPLAHPAIDSG